LKKIKSIMDKPFSELTEEEKQTLDKVGVNTWDFIQSNSGGHKCITNISGLNYLGRKTRPSEDPYRYDPDRPDVPYIKFMKQLGNKFVEILKQKINADKIEVNENREGQKKRKKYKFSRFGDINVTPGLHIDIKEGDEKMGHTNLLNFENSIDYDYDIPRLLEDDNFFNNDNSVYLHDLKVLEPFRGKGLSNLLMNECQNQAKNMGMDYMTLITSCDNDVAQNLYKKHGYEVYISDGVKDFFYKKIK